MLGYSILFSVRMSNRCVGCETGRMRQGVVFEAWADSEETRNKLLEIIGGFHPADGSVTSEGDIRSGNWFVSVHACLEHASIARQIRLALWRDPSASDRP